MSVTKAVVFLGLMAAAAQADREPQQKMAKLMKLGYGLATKAKQGIDNHAFVTGQKIGERVRQEQTQNMRINGVEGRLNAAREGLKDSLVEAESSAKAGVAEARAVVETPDVVDAVKSVTGAISENPEFARFADQADKMVQHVSDLSKDGLSKVVGSIPDENAQKAGSSFLAAFKAGESQQKARLADAKRRQAPSSLDDVVKDHLKVLESKADRIIESAGKTTSVGLDQAPEILQKASKAADV
jgi:hypothetical protein